MAKGKTKGSNLTVKPVKGVKSYKFKGKTLNISEAEKRPIRRAVLNHKVLSSGKTRLTIGDSSKIKHNQCRTKLQTNNNATIKRSGVATKTKRTENLNSAKRGKYVLGLEGSKEIDLDTDEIGSVDNDNDVDIFDRMADQDALNSDDDIVDVSVGAEDQYFGIDNQEGVEEQDHPEGDRTETYVPNSEQHGRKDNTSNDSSMNMLMQNMKNPEFEKLLNKLVNEKVELKIQQERRNSTDSQRNATETQRDRRRIIMDKDGDGQTQGRSTLSSNNAVRTGQQSRNEAGNAGNSHNVNGRLVKSPSDTTLYAPALKLAKQNRTQINPTLVNLIGNEVLTSFQKDLTPKRINRKQDQFYDGVKNDNNLNMIDKISNFIEGIRLETSDRCADEEANVTRPRPRILVDASDNPQPSTSWGVRNNADNRISDEDKLSSAKTRANRIILEAEQYRAQVETPKGKQPFMQQPNLVNMDEEFFHISCHIDQSIRDKIEKGEFVELEKLLPRTSLESDDRMELVNREGQMFFVPATNKENKIRNVRKWEQCFRVYAAIYSAANPHRSHEIWQYVYVINSAASCYVWEEVAQYDYMFRQLMARNPGRSWAVTYTQMWQMTLRHVVNKNGQNYSGGSVMGQNNNNQSGNGFPKKKKHCWKFNKGKCTDPYCKYPHKCFYCDGRHGIHTCFKKNKKGGNDKNASPNLKK